MEVFSSIFRSQKQRECLKVNETRAGINHVKHNNLVHIDGANFNYFDKLGNLCQPKMKEIQTNEFVELPDSYKINLNCSFFDKNDLTIKLIEKKNQIKVIGFQSKQTIDNIIINRKLLRCFNLPKDASLDKVKSIKKQNTLIIFVPKFKKILIDGTSDGESSNENDKTLNWKYKKILK